MNALQAVNRLWVLKMLSRGSTEIRTAYLAAQKRALADVRGMPPGIERINMLALRWLEYFYDEYSRME